MIDLKYLVVYLLLLHCLSTKESLILELECVHQMFPWDEGIQVV